MTSEHHPRGPGHPAGPEAAPRRADEPEHGAPDAAYGLPGGAPQAFAGWQPMPSGPEYDAEGTAFVRLPPELADPSAPLPQGWDPLAAPGTGYTPPPGAHWHPQFTPPRLAAGPEDGGHADERGAQLYATPHDQSYAQHAGPADGPRPGADPAATGHWSLPHGPDQGADPTPGGQPATGQGSIPLAADDCRDEAGEFPRGEHRQAGYERRGAATAGEHDLGHGQQDHPGQRNPAHDPYGDGGAHEAGGADTQGQPHDPHATPQWPVPSALGGTWQWTLPTVGDDSVEETGEYTMSAYRFGLPPHPGGPQADRLHPGEPTPAGQAPAAGLQDHDPYPTDAAGPADYGHGSDPDQAPYPEQGYPAQAGPDPDEPEPGHPYGGPEQAPYATDRPGSGRPDDTAGHGVPDQGQAGTGRPGQQVDERPAPGGRQGPAVRGPGPHEPHRPQGVPQWPTPPAGDASTGQWPVAGAAERGEPMAGQASEAYALADRLVAPYRPRPTHQPEQPEYPMRPHGVEVADGAGEPADDGTGQPGPGAGQLGAPAVARHWAPGDAVTDQAADQGSAEDPVDGATQTDDAAQVGDAAPAGERPASADGGPTHPEAERADVTAAATPDAPQDAPARADEAPHAPTAPGDDVRADAPQDARAPQGAAGEPGDVQAAWLPWPAPGPAGQLPDASGQFGFPAVPSALASPAAAGPHVPAQGDPGHDGPAQLPHGERSQRDEQHPAPAHPGDPAVAGLHQPPAPDAAPTTDGATHGGGQPSPAGEVGGAAEQFADAAHQAPVTGAPIPAPAPRTPAQGTRMSAPPVQGAPVPGTPAHGTPTYSTPAHGTATHDTLAPGAPAQGILPHGTPTQPDGAAAPDRRAAADARTPIALDPVAGPADATSAEAGSAGPGVGHPLAEGEASRIDASHADAPRTEVSRSDGAGSNLAGAALSGAEPGHAPAEGPAHADAEQAHVHPDAEQADADAEPDAGAHPAAIPGPRRAVAPESQTAAGGDAVADAPNGADAPSGAEAPAEPGAGEGQGAAAANGDATADQPRPEAAGDDPTAGPDTGSGTGSHTGSDARPTGGSADATDLDAAESPEDDGPAATVPVPAGPEPAGAEGAEVTAGAPTSAVSAAADETTAARVPEAPADPHTEHPLASYVLRVNGADRPVTGAWIGESLLYVLRERLGFAGAKDGCSQGECGACSVQVDGRLVASCLVPAATTAGSEVRTVEGLATNGQPSDVQRALAGSGAVQCGFCVPGLAMTVHDLLEGNHAPTEQEARQAICGNLCRCSGYRGVLDAVREVVAGRVAAAAADEAAHDSPAGDGGPVANAGPGPGQFPPHDAPHPVDPSAVPGAFPAGYPGQGAPVAYDAGHDPLGQGRGHTAPDYAGYGTNGHGGQDIAYDGQDIAYGDGALHDDGGSGRQSA